LKTASAYETSGFSFELLALEACEASGSYEKAVSSYEKSTRSVCECYREQGQVANSQGKLGK